jgi:hypothetical protein
VEPATVNNVHAHLRKGRPVGGLFYARDTIRSKRPNAVTPMRPLGILRQRDACLRCGGSDRRGPVDYGDSVQFRHAGLAQRSKIVLRLPLSRIPQVAPLAGSPGGRGPFLPRALYARVYRLDVGGVDHLAGRGQAGAVACFICLNLWRPSGTERYHPQSGRFRASSQSPPSVAYRLRKLATPIALAPRGLP